MNCIKELRKKKNWSQAELADKLGVYQTAVSQWETGKTNPDTSTALALADIFEVSLDFLFSREPQKAASNDSEDWISAPPATWADTSLKATEYRLLNLIETQYPSYAAFEKTLNLPAQTVKGWKKGESNSYLETLPNLAGALNTTSSYILGEWHVQNPEGLSFSGQQKETQRNHLKKLQRYKLPSKFSQILRQRFSMYKDAYVEEESMKELMEKLKVTPFSEINKWKQGKGDMNDHEYQVLFYHLSLSHEYAYFPKDFIEKFKKIHPGEILYFKGMLDHLAKSHKVGQGEVMVPYHKIKNWFDTEGLSDTSQINEKALPEKIVFPEKLSSFEGIQKSDNPIFPEASETLEEFNKYEEKISELIRDLSDIDHLFKVFNTTGRAKTLEYARDILPNSKFK